MGFITNNTIDNKKIINTIFSINQHSYQENIDMHNYTKKDNPVFKSTLRWAIVVIVIALSVCLPSIAKYKLTKSLRGNWPGWRGDGSGVTRDWRLPVYWNENENILWKIALPGHGNSSPIVWDNRVYITAASNDGQERMIICLNADNGNIIWTSTITPDEKTKTYPKTGFAAPTPVTDGKRIYAFFDSPGLVAVDMQGNLLWKHSLGSFKSQYNVAASPVIYEDMVIQCSDDKNSNFIIALDALTGDVRWRTPRKGGQNCATPLLITANGQPQIVTNATTIIAYDPKTGKEIWSCGKMMPNVFSSPVFSDGLIYATSGRNGPAIAIDPLGHGDITNTNIKMHFATGGPYVPSPLVYPHLVLPNDNGTMRFIDEKGELLLEEKLGDRFSSSPVGAANRIYWVSERGKAYVIDVSKVDTPKPSVKVMAVNQLEGKCLASPAISNGRLIIRTDKALYCIAGTARAKSPDSDKGLTGSFQELKKYFDDHAGGKDGPKLAGRLRVIEAFSKMKDPRIVPFLLKAVKDDPHFDVWEEAAKALSQHGAPAIDPLIELLDNRFTVIKVIAIENLGTLKAVKATPNLLKTAKNDNPRLRSASLAALGQIGSSQGADTDKIITALLDGLSDEPIVKISAIDGLALVGDNVNAQQQKTIVNALSNCIGSANKLTADKARYVLTNIYKVPIN